MFYLKRHKVFHSVEKIEDFHNGKCLPTLDLTMVSGFMMSATGSTIERPAIQEQMTCNMFSMSKA